MKKSLFSFCLSVVLCLGQPAQSRELVIALSPFLPQAEAKVQATKVMQYLTQLELGDEATLLDGYHLSTLGTFKIPNNASYNNPKAKLAINRTAIGALMRFVKNSAVTAQATKNAVRLPQLLRHIAESYSPEKPMDVIVLGSPFYDDLREPDFSMREGRIPSDGHLLSSRRKTPFGTKDNPELLNNLRVHIGFNDENNLQSDKHRFYIERFWTLYIEQQKGKLITLTGDLTTLFHRVKNGAKPLKHHYVLEQSTKLEMIRLRPQKNRQPIYKRPLSKLPLTPQVLRRAEAIEIGLSWDCEACDLDLYVQPLPNADIIYFNQPTSKEGRYWKDFRTSPHASHGYESIAFDLPLDLQAVQIAVNFYDGDAPKGVSSELRLSVQGKTYAKRFHIQAIRAAG